MIGFLVFHESLNGFGAFMKLKSQAYEQVKGRKIGMHKRMVETGLLKGSLQAESWHMDCRRSGDCRMKEDFELFQEYAEQRQ